MEVLHIQDVQLRPTPLEEVFMTITKKAELEHAQVRRLSARRFLHSGLTAAKWLQIEGRFETLILAEEGIALKIPVGADFIESPGMVLCQAFFCCDLLICMFEYRWELLCDQMDERSLRTAQNL
jgi:hypothetical protein